MLFLRSTVGRAVILAGVLLGAGGALYYLTPIPLIVSGLLHSDSKLGTLEGRLSKTPAPGLGSVVPEARDATRTFNDHKRHSYWQIINAYEQRHHEERLKMLVETAFQGSRVTTYQQNLGYVVAAYYGVGEFAKAAELVLKRASISRTPELEVDLALCLWSLAREQSLEAMTTVVNSLRPHDKAGILSVLYATIPRGVLDNIRAGTHSLTVLREQLTQEELARIERLLNAHPEDPKAHYGYYILGNYQKAGERDHTAEIKDLLLYAQGYEVIRRRILFPNNFTSYTRLPAKNQLDKRTLAELIAAKEWFLLYWQHYSKKVHVDDSCHWIAWITASTGAHDEAFNWLDKCNLLEGDYAWPSKMLRLRLLKVAPVQYLINAFETVGDRWEANRLIDIVVERFPFEECLEFADLPNNKPHREEIHYSLARHEFNRGRFDNVEKLIAMNPGEAQESLKSILKYSSEARLLVETARELDDVDAYAKASSKLRGISEPALAANIAEEAILKFPASPRRDYLAYLAFLGWGKLLSSSELQPKANRFLEKYPRSEYADDVLAELAHSQLGVENNLKIGRRTVLKLIRVYPSGNAVDNALNELAESYFYRYLYDEAREVNNTLIRNYPFTRFARWSVQRNVAIYSRLEETSEGLGDRLVIEPDGRYYVIVASYESTDSAMQHLERLVNNGFSGARAVVHGRTLRVATHGHLSREQADASRAALATQDAWIFRFND